MSKYRLYRVNNSDPKQTGRKNRWLYTIYFLLFFLLLRLPDFFNSLNRKKFPWYGYVTFAAIIVFIIVVVFKKLNSISDSLVSIGTLEFTKTHIKKEIGDLMYTYRYEDILRIELEVYTRDVTISLTRTSSITHLLRIILRDYTEDSFVISDKSLDFKQKFGIEDSLKTICKITGVDILIKDKY